MICKAPRNGYDTYGSIGKLANKRHLQDVKARGICESVLYVDIHGKKGFLSRYLHICTYHKESTIGSEQDNISYEKERRFSRLYF